MATTTNIAELMILNVLFIAMTFRKK